MQVYAVALTSSSQKVRQSIQQHFQGNYYKLNDNHFLVRAENTNVSALSRQLGILSENNEYQDGVIFRLSPHHSGYWSRELWEWMEDAFKE